MSAPDSETAGQTSRHARSDARQKGVDDEKKSEGMNIRKTSAYKAVKGDKENCEALLKTATELATTTTLALYRETGWDQHDPNTENVFFYDHMTKAYLIDWGMAQRHEVSAIACHRFTE